MTNYVAVVAFIACALVAGCASPRARSELRATTSPSSSRTTVPVELDDYVIRMPASVPPGDVTFAVKNVGKHTHNVKVRGAGLDVALAKNLRGGESATLDAHLEPGSYRVTCPVGPHAMMGMRTTLAVHR
jgi:plastocyanin